jgi:hypothetical protein
MNLRKTLGLLSGFLTGLLVLFADGRAYAGCDLIPGVKNSFRGDLGAVDRPFAGPGDLLELQLVGPCDGASPGFGPQAEDHTVTCTSPK